MRSLLAALAHNRDLLRNAGSLAATTGVTSFLGFGYWIYAARFFSPDSVGYATAAIATMTLLGTIGVFGLGTMLIGELPLNKNRGGLLTASLIVSFAGSLALGFGYALVSLVLGNHFPEISGNIWRMAAFSVGVALTGATLTFDDSVIGLMRGGLQLSRNVTVSIAKMVALPASALVFHDAFGLGIMLSWILATLVSLIPTAITIKRGGSRIFFRPDWVALWRLGRVALSHNWLNLAITVPTKLVPVLVAAMVDPQSNAAYYIAAMISSFLFMIPMHLSTVLFAIASAAPQVISEKLRFVLKMSLAIGIPVGLIMGLSAHFVLHIFGSSYASLATGPLWIMIVSYVPELPSAVYIAVCRATGRVTQATILLTSFAVVQMIAVVVGAKIDGLYGVAYGQLAVGIVEGFVTAPLVLRVAFGRSPAQVVRAATAPLAVAGSARELRDLRARQEAGLAVLMSVATTVSPNRTGSFLALSLRETRAEPRATAGLLKAGTGKDGLSTTTSWFPDLDEGTFRERQEAGVAALIAVATAANKF